MQAATLLASMEMSPAQTVIDVTDLIRGRSAAFLFPMSGYAAELPVIRVGNHLYVPLPARGSINDELRPEDIDIALSALGVESATLIELEAGSSRIYALIGGEEYSDVEPSKDLVVVGLGDSVIMYGSSVRYEVVPYVMVSQREVRAVGDRTWIAAKLPAISNPWAVGKEVLISGKAFTASASFYVFNSTERLFAGASVRLVSGGGVSIILRAYSESGGSLTELGYVRAYVQPGQVTAVELPQWAIPNPLYGMPSKLVVTLEIDAPDPGTRAELMIYAGGLGRAEIDGYIGEAFFRYVGGYAPTKDMDTVIGKIGLLKEPGSEDVVFATEPIPMLNGVLSISVYAEVLGNVLEGRPLGNAELVARLPDGDAVIAEATPAYTGRADPITGYHLYKAVLSADLVQGAVWRILIRGADLIIYVRVRGAAFDDGVFSYWAITNLTIRVRYKVPALPEKDAEEAGLLYSQTSSSQESGVGGCKSLHCITSPYLRLDPFLSGWFSEEGGKVVGYVRVTYPAATYSIYYAGEGVEPPGFIRGSGDVGEAPMKACTHVEGSHYYYGTVTYLRSMTIKKFRVIKDALDNAPEGLIIGDVGALVVTGYVRPVCSGACTSIDWSAPSCVSIWSADYISTIMVEMSAEFPEPGGEVKNILADFVVPALPSKCFAGLQAPLSSWWANVLAALGGGSAVATFQPDLSMVPLTTAPVFVLALISPASHLVEGTYWSTDLSKSGGYLSYYLSWDSGTCMERARESRFKFLATITYDNDTSIDEPVRVCVIVVASDKSVGGHPLLVPATASSCGGVRPWTIPTG